MFLNWLSSAPHRLCGYYCCSIVLPNDERIATQQAMLQGAFAGTIILIFFKNTAKVTMLILAAYINL
jgi:hypothetical protein